MISFLDIKELSAYVEVTLLLAEVDSMIPGGLLKYALITTGQEALYSNGTSI